MTIPRLGREPISIEDANRIYEDAQLLFKRYDTNASKDVSEIGNNLKIDPNNFAIRDNTLLVSVVRGNVFDRDLVLKDMTRIGALKGQLGELIVDLGTATKSFKKKLGRIEGRLYNRYTKKAFSKEGIDDLEGVPKTKINKDNLNAMVSNDPEAITAFAELIEMERNLERAREAQSNLKDLDNDLKRADENAKKAQ